MIWQLRLQWVGANETHFGQPGSIHSHLQCCLGCTGPIAATQVGKSNRAQVVVLPTFTSRPGYWTENFTRNCEAHMPTPFRNAPLRKIRFKFTHLEDILKVGTGHPGVGYRTPDPLEQTETGELQPPQGDLFSSLCLSPSITENSFALSPHKMRFTSS